MKHFTMAEMTRSTTAQKLGVANNPTPEHAANIEMTVAQILDPMREAWAIRCAHEQWGTPAFYVSSGYRGFRINAKIGGSITSAHCVGFAFDVVPENGRLAEFKAFARDWLKGRAYDQLISEDEDAKGTPRWMHIGYKNRQGGQRRQLLTMRAGKFTPMSK